MGTSLVEVLVALVVILIVVFMLYSVLVGGTRVRTSEHARLSALEAADAHLESIGETEYDDLPPETRTPRLTLGPDGCISCCIKLRHVPVRGTVRLTHSDGTSLGALGIDYPSGTVFMPQEVLGQEITAMYAYEYPRHQHISVPERPPFQVRLPVFPVRTSPKVLDPRGSTLPASVDCETGVLTFLSSDAGKPADVLYRGANDRGVLEGRYLSDDLRGASASDKGIKLITLTETWEEDGRTCQMEFAYVRAR